MPALFANIQKRLKAFDFKGLFTQELMWNHLQTRNLEVNVDGVNYTLIPVAERGMAVYECMPPTYAQFPKYAVRRKIDSQVSKIALEHIIIFHDHAKTVQVWQWVKREAGKPSACREQLLYLNAEISLSCRIAEILSACACPPVGPQASEGISPSAIPKSTNALPLSYPLSALK
jgi:hypothetical protein